MDKSWIKDPKFSTRYVNGVTQFMKFVKENLGEECLIRCPCVHCLNLSTLNQRLVEDHLLIKGFMGTYTEWIYHGEVQQVRNESRKRQRGDEENDDGNATEVNNANRENEGLYNMLEDFGWENPGNDETEEVDHDCPSTNRMVGGHLNNVPSFDGLLEDLKRELYPGCTKSSTLSFVVKLLHLKVYYGLSNKATNAILELVKNNLPDGETLPKSYYDAMKMLRELGLGYIKIHACKYDCILFRGEYENHNECPVCKTSRWKLNDGKGKKIPHKILRYFPLTPRLKRLYMSRETAKDMRWHAGKRVDDENVLRHPSDSEAWKEFNRLHELFGQEPRNVRLGLATDGFNPFGNQNTNYSMWPVVLVPYNLPPWKCMKEPYLFLSLLIPGPKSPGKDIDVFLQPLIDELKELWANGVDTFDAYSKEDFKMHAAVIWTINDFPAYGDLSGWSTKGYKACPNCNKDTDSTRLRSKICYTGHRRFLPQNHSWRRNGKLFNGKPENRPQPRSLSGEEVLEQLSKLPDFTHGKHPSNESRKRKRGAEELNWTRKTIFFELPYWKTLLLRHNLDVMHIQKNFCDNILNTLFSVPTKTKDTYKAREDLKDINIRRELWLQQSGGKYKMPAACYTLSKEEKRNICEFLKTVKFPDGYASNISSCVSVEDSKISVLKSHDCHIMLQRILPVLMRGFASKDVYIVLVELGNFFQQLCCRTLHLDVLQKLETDIALILCKLEKIFPPAFFDIMEHLPIHLAREAILGGHVQYRWMFPIERYLKRLKGYVRNKARPEGSIAEAYIAEEALTFCSMYLNDVETRFNRPERNHDQSEEVEANHSDVFSRGVRVFGSAKFMELTHKDLEIAQWYALNNCTELQSYFEEHKNELLQQGYSNVDDVQREMFPAWFKRHMFKLYSQKAAEANDDLYALSCGPDTRARHFSGCIVNGVRFHTTARDSRRKTQNCGVIVEGVHNNETIDFYGILTDIIELQYIKGRRIVLFKCKWFDVGNRRTKVQKDGYFTSINISNSWYDNEPYVLATQAKQVFYLADTKLGGNWRVVQKFNHRHIFDVPEQDLVNENEGGSQNLNEDVYQQSDPSELLSSMVVEDHEVEVLSREDVAPIELDENDMNKETTYENDDLLFVDENNEDDTIMEYFDADEDQTRNSDDDSDYDYD